MRMPIWLTSIVALAVFGGVVFMGQAFIQPAVSLIMAAGFSLEKITPNADNNADVTTFSYTLSRGALVSLVFESEDGKIYTFRDQQPRASGQYRVDFSGVVDGFKLPDELVVGEVVRRLMPDGRYTWKLIAQGTERQESDERTGTLILEDGDTELPDMTIFEIAPQVFTPNQDGIDDRTAINIYLTKAAHLTVYLLGENNARIYVPERKEDNRVGARGRHLFDYEGGVDQNADPPPDGTYTVIAEAQDAVGQLVRRTGSLTIQLGGKPLAEIVPQTAGVDVIFDSISYEARYFSSDEKRGDLIPRPNNPQALRGNSLTLNVGDVMVFMLTVENYSNVPIRTSGPPPGTVYQQGQLAATLGEFEQSGAWRVGIHCETSTSDFPWRWAIGSVENLETVEDPKTGNTYYYLLPGQRSVVWGGIRMTNLVERRNPQNCWAGLIHEDVELSVRNNNVGRREVQLVDASAVSN